MLILTLGLLCLALGCSSSDDDDGKKQNNTGGAAGSASGGTGGTAGSTSGGGSGGSSGSGGASGSGSGGTATGGASGSGSGGVAGGASSCVDSSNPMFGSCIEQILVGCYEPDTTGTCTEQNGTTTWSDGSKFVASGAGAGMYGPGATDPCIDLVVQGGNITAQKGNDTLTYEPDSSTNTGTITCPDGSSFTATFEQVGEFNVCKGINCPGG
jgi:hypothetical protein